MPTPPLPWMSRALQHWYRPWSIAQPKWFDPADAVFREHALRLHYPAWCHRYALAPDPDFFADTLPWRLLGLPTMAFDQAARLVGLALASAVDRRGGLARSACIDLTQLRWALERSHFVPPLAVSVLQETLAAVEPGSCAALSLRWCVVDTPSLWARLRLRFTPEQVAHGEEGSSQPSSTPLVQSALTRLWRSAERRVTESMEPA